jgi:uncharacterized membrane protein
MRDIFLILHFIGLAMGLGTSLAFLFLGIASGKMEKEEAKQFIKQTFILGKMGHIGLTLLVVTGLYLMTPYWSTLESKPLLIVKLALVLVLGGVIGVLTSTMKKVKKEGGDQYLKKIPVFGKLALITSLTIVILAVLTFH